VPSACTDQNDNLKVNGLRRARLNQSYTLNECSFTSKLFKSAVKVEATLLIVISQWMLTNQPKDS